MPGLSALITAIANFSVVPSLALSAASGFLLFAENTTAEKSGIRVLRETYRTEIGLALVFCLSLLPARFVVWFARVAYDFWRYRVAHNKARQGIHNLTANEKAILRKRRRGHF